MTSAPSSGWFIRIARPVYCSELMPLTTELPIMTSGFSRAGSMKPPIRAPVELKIWIRSR